MKWDANTNGCVVLLFPLVKILETKFEINIPEIKLNITSGILTENRRLPSIPERSDDVETN